MEIKICLNCGKQFKRTNESNISWSLRKHCSIECKNSFFYKKRNLWRKENPEEYKKERDYYHQRMLDNKELEERYRNSIHKHGQTIKGKFTHYKSGAKQRGLEFSLTKEQFETYWQKSCFYCGDKIKTIGLDRIDNSKGYTIDNVVPCCKICNRMKMNLNKDEFILQCKKITMKGASL